MHAPDVLLLRSFCYSSVSASLVFGIDLRIFFPSPTMADEAANVDQGRQRRRARAAADGERSVRQRLDELETRMDATEALYRSQDTRLLYLEAYTKVVLRGFSSVGDFLKDKERDFKLAKQAFIAAFVHEFRDKAFAEATHVLEEETLLCENNGVVVVGIFPTGGHHGTNPDAVLRLQATWAGGRISYLLATAGKYLPESHQVFSDRVRRNKGEKGGGKGKGKDGKGNGKGKFKPPQAKRAAAPANPQG